MLKALCSAGSNLAQQSTDLPTLNPATLSRVLFLEYSPLLQESGLCTYNSLFRNVLLAPFDARFLCEAFLYFLYEKSCPSYFHIPLFIPLSLSLPTEIYLFTFLRPPREGRC